MTDKETTALALRPASTAISGYVPPPDEAEWGSMVRMANALAKAQGFLPSHFFGQPYKILAAVLYGRDLGISPTNALQHIIVIEGKATADAQLIGMLVRRAGHRLEDVTTETESKVTITRGDDGSVHEFSFSMNDAKIAGIARPGSAWSKYPKAMLYARALTGCARKGAQDALMGTIYTPEEVGAETDAEGSVTAPAGAVPSADIVIDGAITGEIPTDKATPESVAALKQAQAPAVTAASETAATPAPASAEVNNDGAPAQGAATAGAPSGPSSKGGPRAKRGNVVPAPQGAQSERSAAGVETPPQETNTAIQPPATTSAPPVALVDEEDADEAGRVAYLEALRQEVRKLAALLIHLRIKRDNLRFATEIDLGNRQAEPLPSLVPSPGSDVSLSAYLRERHTKGEISADTLEALTEQDLTTVTNALEATVKSVHDKGIHE